MLAVIAAAVLGQNVLFVDGSGPGGDGSSWETAFGELHEALAEAGANGRVTEIWVAAGTYLPGGGARTDSFELVSGVSVYGGFAGDEDDLADRDPEINETVLSGDFAGDDVGFGFMGENALHVVSGVGVSDAALDGFTVMRGFADFAPGDLLGGGGLFLVDSEVEVRGCRFEWNRAGSFSPSIGGFGGGAYVLGGQVVFSGCVFDMNHANNGGALGLREFETTAHSFLIEGCTFTNNANVGGIGGAVFSSQAPFDFQPDRTVVFTGCHFEGNESERAGAIVDQNTPHLLIDACSFVGNTSVSEAGAVWIGVTANPDEEPAVVRDCLFLGNTAENSFGGALIFTAADGVVAGCRFVGNAAPKSVGGALRTGPVLGFDGGAQDLFVQACEFSGNTALGAGAITTANTPLIAIDSSTFSANSADLFSGAVIIDAQLAQVRHSVFWGNELAGVQNEPAQIDVFDASSNLFVDFSLVQGLTGQLGGSGNIGDDPMFLDADGEDDVAGTLDDDVRPGRRSPVIDAGNAALLPADLGDLDRDGDAGEPLPLDLAGVDRVLGSETDMGAFEFGACAADFNGDGALNILDFVAFQNAFQAGDDAADANGDGVLNILDFVAFQALFVAGCA